MANSENKNPKKIWGEANIDEELPNRNESDQPDIEQARIEYRREADLEDKTPAGDAGVEDNRDEESPGNATREVNY